MIKRVKIMPNANTVPSYGIDFSRFFMPAPCFNEHSASIGFQGYLNGKIAAMGYIVYFDLHNICRLPEESHKRGMKVTKVVF
jgi:hypothetical protein